MITLFASASPCLLIAITSIHVSSIIDLYVPYYDNTETLEQLSYSSQHTRKHIHACKYTHVQLCTQEKTYTQTGRHIYIGPRPQPIISYTPLLTEKAPEN